MEVKSAVRTCAVVVGAFHHRERHPRACAELVRTCAVVVGAFHLLWCGSAIAQAGSEPIVRKSGDGFTLLTRGGEFSIYGNLEVSLDDTTKGIANMTAAGAPTTPPGRNGWLPAISTNLSYVGVRGIQSLGNFSTSFVYQLETQIDISASSGRSASNSNNSDVVKGGLTSRNSFVGLASQEWGTVKIGKTDAPYKTSTASMNPFSGMLGDYSVIMGNSGGDNRVEFGTRIEHALWYESPRWGGASFNVLLSPGQNRASDNSNLAAGASDCAGAMSRAAGAHRWRATMARLGQRSV